MSTPDTKETSSAMPPPPPPPNTEERICILCHTDLGHLPLKKLRAHIEHCLNKPSKDAAAAIPEHTDNPQTHTSLSDLNPDTDTDATLTDDELQDRDLPPPYASFPPTTTRHPRTADSIASTKYPPLTPPTAFLTALTHPTSRSTRALHAIALNTQTALLTWQDEYLALETELARLSEHRPRPLHPRRPLDPLVFEDMKTAGLYGFKYDAHESRVGAQDPFAHLRTGRTVGGKVLRERKGLGKGRGGGLGESEDEGAGARGGRRAGRRGEGSETGGSRAASVVGGRGGGGAMKRRFEETPEAGLSSDAARPPPRKRGRPRLIPLAGSRLGISDGRGGTAATSEVTTEAEVGMDTGLETEEGGTPAPAIALTAGPGVPGRLNLLDAKRRGRKPKLGAAAAMGRLPGLVEEGSVGPGGPPKEKKRKGRPPGVFGKYWGEAAKRLKLKSQRVVDSGADS